MLWNSAKDKLIEHLESENKRLAEQNIRLVSENDILRQSALKSTVKPKAEDSEKKTDRPVTMLDWCRRQSSRSYQYATSKGKMPLVAGVPVGAANPEAKRDRAE